VTIFASRRDRLRHAFPPEVECFAVRHPVNVTYLTGFTGEASWVLLTSERAIIVSDGRFEVQLAQECPDIEVVIRPTHASTIETVGATLTRLGVRQVGLEASHVTLAEAEVLSDTAPSVNWTRTRGLVEKLRQVKDDSEIAAIRSAIRVAERAFHMVVAMLTGDETEADIVADLEHLIRRAGGSGTSFPTIAAVGDHAALPHAPATNRRLSESPFLLLDWGATCQLYKSDLTRVIRTGPRTGFSTVAAREIESRLEKLYTVVRRGQELAIESIRAGVRVSDVDATVRGYFEQEGYTKEFNHGLGHGIGLQIHEGPSLRSNSDEILQAGNVITVEPGLYLPGFGGVRIEDDVLVHPDGCEVLTSVPKDWSACLLW
jgi:Xaa-Pro aminopeptidase